MKNANVIPFSPPDGAAPDGAHGPADGSPVSDGTRVVVDAERIVVERLVLVDAGLAGFIAERSPADRASLARARAPDRARRAPGRRGHGQRRCGPARVRRAPGQDRAGQRAGRGRARPAAPPELRRRRWPPAADARDVPGRPRQAPGDRRRSCSTRRSATPRSARCGTLLETYFDGDALAPGPAPRPDPDALAAPPVPGRGHRRVHQASTTGSSRSRRRDARGPASGRGPPRRAPTSRTCSRRMLGDIARGAGRPARPHRAPTPATSSGRRRATSS